MIKTLKTSISAALSNADKSKLTIFKIRFPKELFKDGKNGYTVKLNFSEDSKIQWGDGTITSSPDSPIDSGFTHSHTYQSELVNKEQVITIICEGYPQYNPYSLYNTECPFDSNVLYRIESLSKYTQSALRLFAGCKQLKTVPENLFAGTEITMFNFCFAGSGLTSIPEKLFDFAAKSATFNRTFFKCEDLIKSDLVFGGPNTASFGKFIQIFGCCKELKSVNQDMFKYVMPDASVDEAFMCCDKISIPQGLFDSQTQSTFYRIFSNINLTAADFLGPIKRIPLDLFAHVTKIVDNPEKLVRSIFDSAVNIQNIEEFKREGRLYPDAFKLRFGFTSVQLNELDIFCQG